MSVHGRLKLFRMPPSLQRSLIQPQRGCGPQPKVAREDGYLG